MKNFGDVLVAIVVAIVAVLMIALMVILGLEFFHLTGAIVAGVMMFGIELLIYLKWSWIEENLLQPVILLAVICFVGYWAWQGVKWLYFAALVPLGQSYVALVAGVIALNANSIAIAIPLGIVVAILVGLLIWRIVVWIKNW